MQRAFWLLLLLWVVPCRAQDRDLTLRLPTEALRALAQPDGWRRDEVRERLLASNPWADRVRVSGDLRWVRVVWEAEGSPVVVLSGERLLVYRMALGAASQAGDLVQAEEKWVRSSIAQVGEDLLVQFTLARIVEPEEAIVGGPEPEESSAWDEFSDRLQLTLRFLGSHRWQEPSLGSSNPENQVFNLPSQVSTGEARLDFSLDLDRLRLWGKPRATLTRESWTDGPDDGETETDTDLMWLEGAARGRLTDSLFLSFGRETLLWGPGQYTNPSNPFFPDNGRENPIREIPGQDFFRAVWLPDFSWTVSFLWNVGLGEGELPGQTWHPSQALKVEYVGFEANGGVLVHAGADHPTSFRGFGRWTASDAMLVYGEGSLSFGTNALYAEETSGGILALEQSKDASSEAKPSLLFGTSYTFEVGSTVYIEYIYNGDGYTDTEAQDYFDLAHGAAAFALANALRTDADAFHPGLRLLRRNYLFLQYLQTEIANEFTANARWIQDLDDSSALATLFLEWNVSDRWRLFGFGGMGTGGNRDEFGNLVRYLGSLGLEFSAF